MREQREDYSLFSGNNIEMITINVRNVGVSSLIATDLPIEGNLREQLVDCPLGVLVSVDNV